MDTVKIAALRKAWEEEEKIAHIHGWDFSNIHGRYEEEDDLPWDYKQIIEENGPLTPSKVSPPPS